MWFAITSMAFGAAIGLNVFALWLADRFGQLQKANEELGHGVGLIERETTGRYCSAPHGLPVTVQ